MNSAQLSAFQVAQGVRTQAQADALLAQYPNDTKWYDYYYKKNVPLYQTDVSISGGSNKTTYYISGSYFKAEGIAYRSAFDRYTFRSNLATEITKFLKAGVNLSFGTDNRQTNAYGSNSTNGGLSLLAQPWFSPYDANGNEYYGVRIPGWERYSPRYLADKNPANGNNLQGNPSAYIQFNPIKNLVFKSQGGMDVYIYRSTSGRLPSYANALGAGTLAEAYDRNILKTWTNTLEYKFNVNANNFTVLAGQEYTDGTSQGFSASTSGLANDNLYLLGNGDETNRSTASSKSEYAYKSLFGRLEYNFSSKYFFDASVREDRSSRFGADNQNAVFLVARRNVAH
jgi:hypothetical protein